MKRLFSVFLLASLLLTALSGCLQGNQTEGTTPNATTPNVTTPESTTPEETTPDTTTPEETTPEVTFSEITTPSTSVETTAPSCVSGHTVVHDNAVAAICTNPALTYGKHCSVCGEIIKPQEEIPSDIDHYILDNDNDNRCDYCGLESTCPSEWVTTDYMGHYKEALCDCCTYSYHRMEHVGLEDDYFCDICGYEEPHPYYLAEKETWLNEISAEDIVEIYGTQSGMGTKTYGLERFITITDKAQIAEIFEMAKTIYITPFPPETAGYYPTDESRYIQFTLADGTVYYIHQMGCTICTQNSSSYRNGYEGMKLENIPQLDEYENESVFYQLYSINAADGIVYFDIPNTPVLYDAVGKIALDEMDFTIDLNADLPDVTTDAFIQTKWMGNLEILSATTFSYSGILCTLKDGKTFYDWVDTSSVDQLIAAHEAKYNDGRKATVSTYYGQFASGALVGMIVDDKTTYQEYEWADEAYNGRIKYTDSNRIVVLYNGEFYTLREAYKQHIIGDNDLHLIREMHDSRP